MKHTNAFSLVELSIVLVILGLLTGGILTGQSLIRAAELRSVTTEFQTYQTAVQTFRDKYFALPGDMRNATDFWGAAASCPGTSATPSVDQATCSGDGSGELNTDAASSNEMFRFWQHLANAGLIEGSYSGVANNSTATEDDALIGTNVPASSLSRAGWTPQTIGSIGVSSTVYFEGNYATVLHFGGMGSGSTVTRQAVITAEEAWNIDTKVDDGKPGSGAARTREGAGVNCNSIASSNSAAIADTAAYNLSESSVSCNLIFSAF